jgi:hypothetical protein
MEIVERKDAINRYKDAIRRVSCLNRTILGDEGN